MKLSWLLVAALVFCAHLARGATAVADCTEAALRAAISEDSEVLFEEACDITLTNQIVITRDTTIDGGGYDVTISGGSAVRLFAVRNGAKLTLSGIRLAAGQSTYGGALFIQGNSSAVITNCTFEYNKAVGSDGVAGADGEDRSNGNGESGDPGTNGTEAQGGAIYSAGSLRLLVCQFFTNSATAGAGGEGGVGGDGGFHAGNGGDGGNGGDAYGGAVFSAGPLYVSDCLFEGNTCEAGDGAMGGDAGSGTFYGYPGEGGAAGQAAGAGLYSAADTVILGATFFANIVTGGDSAETGTDSGGMGQEGADGGLGQGGGLYANAAAVTNCTFYGNEAYGGNGGHGGPGIYTGGDGGNGGNGVGGALASDGVVRLVNSTFLNNSALGGTNGLAGDGPFAGSDGKVGKANGGHLGTMTGTVTLKNSILGTNAAGGGAYGEVFDAGYNIVADSTFTIRTTTSKKANARLGTLANNGGPTPTIELLTNSPAINAAHDASAPPTDQRGVKRPAGTHADIGAYERGLAISGRVLLNSAGLSGVLINAGEVEVETDSSGYFTAPAGNGSVTVTPRLAGYQFAPTSTNLPNVTSNVSGILFTAYRVYSMSGRVWQGTNGLAGITVMAGTNSTITSSSGSYSFEVPAGSYLLYPTSVCYRFAPTSTNAVAGSSTNKFDFQATPDRYTVSGTITVSTNSSPLAGVSVGIGASTNVTDGAGVYTITNLCRGSYQVVPSLAGFGFSPLERTVDIGPDATNVNFTAVPGVVLSGRVLEGAQPVADVEVYATNALAPLIAPAVTDTNGTFVLLGFQPGYTYAVTPNRSGYGFSPTQQGFIPGAQTNFIQFQTVPFITLSTISDGSSLQLTYPGSSGQTYQVEYSTNLTDWSVVGTTIAPVKFTAPISNNPASYYRLRRQ